MCSEHRVRVFPLHDEFELIATFFERKKSVRKDVLLGIGDDCAVVQPSSNNNLAVTLDTLNEGIHFFPDTAPFDIGYKSVAVSLSDLAAMGAQPAWLLLGLTLASVDEEWLKNFSEGLFNCMDNYGVELIGGNTTRGHLAITTQVTGLIPKNKILRRDSAKPGDLIYVTGTLGDAGLALKLIQNKAAASRFSADEIEFLNSRLFRPTPRIKEGLVMRDIASAAIDLSDGLAADLQHILAKSQVGASIYLEQVPLSPALLKNFSTEYFTDLILNSGDDYELCFTVSPSHVPELNNAIKKYNFKITCIGKIETDLGLRIVLPNGNYLILNKMGYRHF